MRMRKKTVSVMILFLMTFLFVTMLPAKAVRAEAFVNNKTGYYIVVEDDAGLLSEDETEKLIDDMKGISSFGHVVFKSIDQNSKSTTAYAEDYYYDKFGNESGVVFLIDMDNRNIYIVSAGEMYKTITKAKANTITDNIYREASKEHYYECARQAFLQMRALLQGSAIAEPMKHVSNAILALIIAMLIFFVVVNSVSRAKKAGTKALVSGAKKAEVQTTKPEAVFINQTKKYSPVSRSSGGHGGGGGGGGGGGFSGGGGGHGF